MSGDVLSSDSAGNMSRQEHRHIKRKRLTHIPVDMSHCLQGTNRDAQRQEAMIQFII